MSRYDYRDPGTDPAYCDPLRADDDIDVPDFDQPDDAAEHAAQSLLVAIADVQRHLQQVRTLEEGHRVQKWVRLAWKALDRLALDASEIIDQAIERRR